jgi:tetratricopeptide (TPR) repeat protein
VSWVLAVDFGTSNTTAAHTVDGVPQVLEVDGGRYLPSAVVADTGGSLVTGKEARHQVSLYPERAERTPKRKLATGDPVVLGQRAYPAAEVAGAVLARMYGEAVRFHGGTSPDVVILTHPARWGEPVTRRLREAAMLAGITGAVPLRLLPEPEAAAWFYAPPGDGQVVAVFDLGGGTLDTAVLRAAGGGFALAGQPGGDANLGGEDFDELLLDWVAARARERDEGLWEELESGAGRRASRDRARLRAAVTDAKEALSTHVKASVVVGDFEDEFLVTRGDFEKLIAGTVDRAVTELRRTIAASGVSVASLAALYLTGGSSRVPLIGRRLWQALAVQPQLRDDPKTVVVVGALRAHAEAAAAKAKAAARKAAEREAAARAAREAARKAREEAERRAREEAERRAREEAARKARAAAERMGTGKALYEQHRYAEAEAAYKEAIRLNPGLADAHSSLGFALRSLGRYAEAEAACRKAIRLNPGLADAHNALGGALHMLGRYAEAMAAFREAIRLNPGLARAHSNLGGALYMLGRYAEAVAACREAIRLDLGLALAHSNLGAALWGLGRYVEVVAACREAIRLDPGLAEAHNALGGALQELKRYAEAMAAYREAIRLNPGLAEAHSNLGGALQGLKRYAEAEAACREAIRLDPGLARAHNHLGLALRGLGRRAEAEAAYREAIRLDPGLAAAHQNLAALTRKSRWA